MPSFASHLFTFIYIFLQLNLTRVKAQISAFARMD
jgi:hypothetical protein